MRVEASPGFFLNVERSGSGAPVVLLHGFTGSARSWGRFGRLLAERFMTISIDIIGHGQSDSPVDLDYYRMPRAAADVVALIDPLGLPRSGWLGYSMGGRLALQIASAFPEHVERLALIGASAGLATAAEREARVASDAKLVEMIENSGIRAFVDYWEGIPLFGSQKRLPAEVRDGIRAGRLANNPIGLANSLRGMGAGAQAPLYDQLPRLPMPVLAIAGELDVKYTEIAHDLAAAIPGAQALIVHGSGHACQVEQPELCASALAAFLAGSNSVR